MGLGLLRLIVLLATAGTALTNSVAETVLASTVIPANSMAVGKLYRLRAHVRATLTNATDTLRVRLRIGTTTLTGTVCYDSTAVDVANDDNCHVDVIIAPRSASGSTSGTVAVTGQGTILGAEGTVTTRSAQEYLTGVNYTVDQRVEITGLWSVASASDSAQSELFSLEEIG